MKTLCIALATGLIGGACTAAWCGEPKVIASDQHPLHLRTGLTTTARPAVEDPLRVLHLDPGKAAASVTALERTGARVLAHLSGSAILVAYDGHSTEGIPGVVAASAWSPAHAIVPELARMSMQKAASFTYGVPVILGMARGSDLAPTVERLQSNGAEIRWTDPAAAVPQIGALVPAGHLPGVLQTLRAASGLVFADLQPALALRNAASVWRCQSGRPAETPVFDHGLRGEGQVVGIVDTGIDVDMCYFRDDEHGLPALNGRQGTEVDLDQRKVLAVDFLWQLDWPEPGPADWDDHGHGTHVAGSVAGDDLADRIHRNNDGMAPAARLVIQDGGYERNPCADLPGLGCPLQDLTPVLQQAYDQGARLHSNSWGDEEDAWPQNRYTERTADVDRFSWNHKDFLVFFAAGNSGDIDIDSVGSPATGKNVVAVGATVHGGADPPCPAYFSSRGWTQDGRIKPDVMAPGHWVMSAGSDYDVTTMNCSDQWMSGTSMACPTTAGLGALVRQYFTDGFYPEGAADPAAGFTPSAALVKATLIASAVDITELGCAAVGPIPSREQGWGLVQLDQALYFPGSTTRLMVDDNRQGFSGTNDAPAITRFRTAAEGPLKVVLVWTDPPSSSVAMTNLVNDLDLDVAGPNGGFRGNSFVNGASYHGGTHDRLNNVEVVRLREAAAGWWTVTVSPHAISRGPQDYALVISGALDGLEVRGGGSRLRP